MHCGEREVLRSVGEGGLNSVSGFECYVLHCDVIGKGM